MKFEHGTPNFDPFISNFLVNIAFMRIFREKKLFDSIYILVYISDKFQVSCFFRKYRYTLKAQKNSFIFI
jgi:hypothetical protein